MKNEIKSVTIGIAVKNVAEATQWYKSLLGDVEIIEPAPGTIEFKLADHIWLQLDDTGYLEIDGRSSIMRMETNDIVNAHELVKKLTDDVEDIVTIEGVVEYFDFKDIDGNRLSFVQLLDG